MPLCVASGDTLVASGRSTCKLRFVSVPIDCSKRSVTFGALMSPTAVHAFRIHAVD